MGSICEVFDTVKRCKGGAGLLYDTENTAVQGFQYENRFVCFMDVLGFKRLVNDSAFCSKSMERVRALSLLFSRERESYLKGRWGSRFKMAFPNDMSVRDKLIPELSIPVDVSLFSDSIIVSYKPEQRERFIEWYSQLTQIFHDICRLQATFAAEGFYIRGGLSYGKLYHAGDICVGPALIEAVQLESQAVYPYIAVSTEFAETVLRDIQSDEFDDYSPGYKRPLKLGEIAEGFYSSYLDRVWTGLPQENKFKLDFLMATLYERPYAMRAIKDGIVKELSKPYPCSIKEKYRWLKDYFNQTLYALDGHLDLLITQ